MKIGIITLNGYYNYGNRLQNYALQEYLKKMGHEVETIIVDNRTTNNKKNKVEKVYNELKELGFSNFVNKLYVKISKKMPSLDNNAKDVDREELFKIFTSKYINETSFKVSEIDIPNSLLDDYDYFIVGSDQVWNPSNTNNSSVYFLGFAPENKRISYAASFGVSELLNYQRAFYFKHLSSFKSISVREHEGAAIVENIIKSRPLVVVDPTMLLSKENWSDLMSEPKKRVGNNYLLTYFLGKIPAKYKSQIDIIASQYNLDIINLGDKKSSHYITGPREFLHLIKNCSLMCTDSFHGLVFSIIFEKPFVAYNRIGSSSSMISRINTLLDKFDLKERYYDKIDVDSVINMDYERTNLLLNEERGIAFRFLKNSLQVIEVNQ